VVGCPAADQDPILASLDEDDPREQPCAAQIVEGTLHAPHPLTAGSPTVYTLR
jgi:hypothetical protein